MDSYVVTYALIGLLALTSAFEIDISQKAYFSWETTFYIGFILSYPTVTVALGGIVAGFILSFRKGKRWLSFFYSYTIICLSSIIAYELSLLAFNRSGQIFHISLLSLVFFAVVYFTANMFFVFLSYYVRFGVDGLVDGAKSIFTGALLGVYGVGILTGYLLALVIHSSGLRGTILFTALILIVSRVYREYFKMAQHFKDLAITDELTRLHNHRYIHTWMDDR
ncbi:MAG: hypothetical protein OWT27_08895, partial [Firmicutes bacterium]|nr:hypothetical protein [Bacillota bacterium]